MLAWLAHYDCGLQLCSFEICGVRTKSHWAMKTSVLQAQLGTEGKLCTATRYSVVKVNIMATSWVYYLNNSYVATLVEREICSVAIANTLLCCFF